LLVLLTLMFYVSQGSVATYAMCGRILNTHLTVNLVRNLPVKNFFKSVKILQNYGHESVARFFGPPCTYKLLCGLHSVRPCLSVRPSHRSTTTLQQQHLAGLLLRSGEGPQQISLDSCCCRATCGSRKFWSDCKEVLHTCF